MRHSQRLASALAVAMLVVMVGSAAGQQGTPQPGAQWKSLFRAPVSRGPWKAPTVYVARLPYAVGEGDRGLVYDGPVVIVGRSGTTVAQTGSEAERLLRPGEGIVVPPQTQITLRNEGPDAAENLVVALLASDVGNTGGLFALTSSELWPLLGKGEADRLVTPATLTIERVTLPPGATIGQETAAGFALVNVEAGTVMTAIEQGLAEASSGAFLRTGAIGPGSVFLGPGSERRLRDGAGLFAHDGTAFTLSNEDDEPVTLLVIRLTPDAGSGTPAS